MKRISLLIFFLVLILLNAKSVFAVTCNQIGNTTYCSDGTSYNQIGNTTYGSDGTSYNQIGNTTYGSNGTSCNRIGNTTYCSNGTSYNQIGNSVYGSDGSSYQQIGNTTYGSGGAAFNTCPANSTYDSSSGKCTCSYGYSVDSSKTSCIYTGTYTAPTTLSCPLNSYYDGISSCKCDSGYMASGGSCITYNQSCQNQYGYNTYGDSNSCYCSAGYQWNTSRTSCVPIPAVVCPLGATQSGQSCVCAAGSVYKNGQCLSNTADCELSFGSNVVGVPGSNNNSSCGCASGYQWNSSKTACQAIPAPVTNYSSTGSGSFTSTLQLGSSGAQVTLLQTLLVKLGYLTGNITGYYGNLTQSAVVMYQTSHNIPATGTVGPKTRASLNSNLSSQ